MSQRASGIAAGGRSNAKPKRIAKKIRFSDNRGDSDDQQDEDQGGVSVSMRDMVSSFSNQLYFLVFSRDQNRGAEICKYPSRSLSTALTIHYFLCAIDNNMQILRGSAASLQSSDSGADRDVPHSTSQGSYSYNEQDDGQDDEEEDPYSTMG